MVAAFSPTELSVRDVSGGCGSMYSIDIASARFRGANMLKQQRMVNAELADLVKGLARPSTEDQGGTVEDAGRGSSRLDTVAPSAL